MQGFWHEITVDEFLKRFTPGRNLKPSQIREVGGFEELGVDYENIDEKALHSVLCRVFNAVLSLTEAKAVFNEVTNGSELGPIDICSGLVLYPTDSSYDRVAYRYHNKSKSQEDAGRRQSITRCGWPWMQLFVECKCTEKGSAFSFRGGDLLRDTPEAQTSRAQISLYAAEIQLRQHRTHLFSLYFCAGQVRLQRWDRAGCVVSEPIDLRCNPAQMLNFVFRFANLTQEQAGYDPTATLATPQEIKKWDDYRPTHVELLKYRKYALQRPSDYPIYKVSIPSFVEEQQPPENPKKRKAESTNEASASRTIRSKDYLIGQPISVQCKAVGRATKAYFGLDVVENRLVFIKDQWRVNAAGSHSEMETYERLRSHEVLFVPTCLGGGDVMPPGHRHPQRTVTHKYLPEGIENCERFHTRLVLKELGRPLETYTNSGELITVTFHAFLGHSLAWKQAGVLHRDVSTGNIMISVEPPAYAAFRGLLTDWDLCTYKEDLEDLVPAPPRRSGTWPFISALSLRYPRKPWEVADDVEAFIYILVYMAFRFQRHTLTPKKSPAGLSPDALREQNERNPSFAIRIFTFFWEEEECEDDYVSGGSTKLWYLQLGTPPVELTNARCPLATLLESLYELLREHYAAINYADLKQYECRIKESDDDYGWEASIGHHIDARTTGVLPYRRDSDEEKILARVFKGRDPRQGGGTTGRLPTSLTEGTVARIVRREKRVLDDHRLVIGAFYKALHKDGKRLNFSQVKDKWFDQFDGLQAFVQIGAQKSSISRTSNCDEGEVQRTEYWQTRVRGDSGWRVIHQPETVPEEEAKAGAEVRKDGGSIKPGSGGEDETAVIEEGLEQAIGPGMASAEAVEELLEPGAQVLRRSRRLANKRKA